MAKSFIEYDGKGFWIDDYLIETWLILLVNDLKNDTIQDTWIQELIHLWTIQATYGFTGCVSPELDNVLINSDRKKLLISSTERLLDKLQQRKNDFTSEELNSLGIGGEGFRFIKDIPPHTFQDIGKQFLALIKEKGNE